LQAAPHAVESLAEVRDLVATVVTSSGTSILRLEMCSAASESCVMGSMMSCVSIMFRITNSKANTTASELMNVTNARLALRIGSPIGTETICAPMISFSFQPKPLLGP